MDPPLNDDTFIFFENGPNGRAKSRINGTQGAPELLPAHSSCDWNQSGAGACTLGNRVIFMGDDLNTLDTSSYRTFPQINDAGDVIFRRMTEAGEFQLVYHELDSWESTVLFSSTNHTTGAALNESGNILLGISTGDIYFFRIRPDRANQFGQTQSANWFEDILRSWSPALSR